MLTEHADGDKSLIMHNWHTLLVFYCYLRTFFSFYYKNDKERLREQARDKYRNLFEEEENKQRGYGKNRYHNMFEEKKQRLKEYLLPWS